MPRLAAAKRAGNAKVANRVVETDGSQKTCWAPTRSTSRRMACRELCEDVGLPPVRGAPGLGLLRERRATARARRVRVSPNAARELGPEPGLASAISVRKRTGGLRPSNEPEDREPRMFGTSGDEKTCSSRVHLEWPGHAATRGRPAACRSSNQPARSSPSSRRNPPRSSRNPARGRAMPAVVGGRPA